MQTNDFSNLPTSWQIKTLKSFGIFIRGVSYKKEQLLKEKTTNSVFLLRANNIQEKLDLTDLQIIPKELADGKIVQDNDIVFAMSSGSKHIVGKNIILSNLQDYSFGAFCGLFRITNKDLNSHYLAYFLQSDFYRKYIVKFAKGTNINNVRFNDLENLQIPLPPLEIQKRIVARLERAFEKIEKGSAHLQDAKTKLAKYKQSLLKSAFDGTLFCHTESEARSISNQEFRDISLTLNMTNSPSLRANEASVAIHESKVDCHDLTSSNLAMTDKENPKLPQGWTIKTLGEVCEILDNMRKPINSTEREQRLKNSTTKYAYYGATGQVGYIDDFLCDFESILLGEDGAPFLEPFKDKAYIVSGKYWVNNHAHILKAKENFAINKFVCYFLNIVDYMPYVSGTTRLKLNQSAMKQIKIPLPPLETQKQIVKLLEKHLQHADKTGEFIESALNKAKQLKQSLLKSAFLGKLT